MQTYKGELDTLKDNYVAACKEISSKDLLINQLKKEIKANAKTLEKKVMELDTLVANTSNYKECINSLTAERGKYLKKIKRLENRR